MRKFLLFLVVFGLGLLALYLLQDAQRRPKREPLERPPEQAPTDPNAPPTSVPAQSQDTQAPPGHISGATKFFGYQKETGVQAYFFDADLEHLGQGRYLARDLRLEMYDASGRTRVQTIEAGETRLRIELDSQSRPSLGDAGRVEMQAVVIEREIDNPFAPLTIRSPSFSGSLETRVLTSGEGDLVELEGRGLQGSGRGFTYRESADQIAFERGGELRLTLDNGGHARLATTGIGPIRLARSFAADGSERYLLEAGEGAQISYWEAAAPLTSAAIFVVSALHLSLNGTRGAEGFILKQADAVGELEAERGRDRFFGERALVHFDQHGAPERIVIQGSPHGEMWLETERAERTLVRTEGAGDLTIQLGERDQFRQAGPAQLTIPLYEIILRADETLGAVLDQDQLRAKLDARGNVRLSHGPEQGEPGGPGRQRVLTTDQITATLTATDTGDLKAFASGRTHVLGSDRAGNAVDLESAGQLELHVAGEEWSVPLAENVRLAREGAQAFQASAARVLDLDSARGSFVIEGKVTYASRLGRGRALRANATSPEHLELLGAPGDLAHFEVGVSVPAWTESANFDALEIDLYPDRLEARGEARAEVHALERDYRLASDFVRLSVEPLDRERQARPFTLECTGVKEARLLEQGVETFCRAEELLAVGLLREAAAETQRLETSRVTVKGRVEVRHQGELELHGSGDLFTVDAQGVGRLEASDTKRVTAWGKFSKSSLPYEMTARSVRFDAYTLDAEDPRVYLAATLLPVFPRGKAVDGVTEVHGDALRVEQHSIWLLGNAEVEGLDRTGQKLRLTAQSIRLDGDVANAGDLAQGQWIRGLEATGGFNATYENAGTASGASFSFTRERAVLLGQPAQLGLSGMYLASEQIDIDLQRFLIATKSGSLWSTADDAPWRLDFASMQPIVRGAETLFVVREPRSSQGDLATRAAWAVAWVDIIAWAMRGNEALWGKPKEGEAAPLPAARLPKRDLYENPFRRIVSERVGLFIEKLYLEGEVEIVEGDERSARADALLVDLRDNTGYMQNAEVLTSLDVFGDREQVRTRAGNLRMAADGSLHAKQATITSCEFVEPHYYVQTGELSLDPRPGGGWRLSARKNRLRFGEGVQLPLPPIGGLVLDEEGDIKGFETASGEVFGVDSVGVGDSPRFGTSVTTGVHTEAGPVGLSVGKLAGFKSSTLRGRWKYDGSFLGSRGVLLGIGLELRERDPDKHPLEQAWLNIYASGLSDVGRDRGYVRVAEDDRDHYRAWYRARGRYPLSQDEWIDVALTHQTDPGVQAEFFERLYTRFEQRDNELHYRRAEGSRYFQAAVKARIDDSRTEVEELPSAGVYQGATPIARLGHYDLLYSGALDVAYLRRRQGTLGEQSDAQALEGFTEYNESVFADGLGDREVARIDSTHALELPFNLGYAGLRAKPFVEAQLTAWDKGVVEDDEPSRAGLFSGLELATTFWRRTSGAITSVTPLARMSEELILEDSGEPVRFDLIDEPIDGDQVELGLRTRWVRLDRTRSFDLDLRSISRRDRTHGAGDLHTLAALADLRTKFGSVPVALRNDYRYDQELGTTAYWRSAIGLQPIEDLQLEFAYTRGQEVTDPILAEALSLEVDDPRFEAASGKLRYRLTPKWEVEFSQTYSLINDGRLDSDFILRRFDHDFLVELGVGTRSGEGAAFGIGFQPLLGWRPKRLGLIE